MARGRVESRRLTSPISEIPSAERGDPQNEFIEITEAEANQIVARIHAEVTGANNG